MPYQLDRRRGPKREAEPPHRGHRKGLILYPVMVRLRKPGPRRKRRHRRRFRCRGPPKRWRNPPPKPQVHLWRSRKGILVRSSIQHSGLRSPTRSRRELHLSPPGSARKLGKAAMRSGVRRASSRIKAERGPIGREDPRETRNRSAPLMALFCLSTRVEDATRVRQRKENENPTDLPDDRART